MMRLLMQVGYCFQSLLEAIPLNGPSIMPVADELHSVYRQFSYYLNSGRNGVGATVQQFL